MHFNCVPQHVSQLGPRGRQRHLEYKDGGAETVRQISFLPLSQNVVMVAQDVAGPTRHISTIFISSPCSCLSCLYGTAAVARKR